MSASPCALETVGNLAKGVLSLEIETKILAANQNDTKLPRFLPATPCSILSQEPDLFFV